MAATFDAMPVFGLANMNVIGVPVGGRYCVFVAKLPCSKALLQEIIERYPKLKLIKT